MKRISKAALVGAGMLVIGSRAVAAPLPNLSTSGNKWRLTNYNDTSTTQPQVTTHELCFATPATAGTGVTGNWKALTFAGWDGRYYQEGDEFRFFGDYASNVGHDFVICNMISNTLAGCTWDEWREDASYGIVVTRNNAKMERIGTCTITAAVAPRLTADGAEAIDPGAKGQESLKDYQLRTGN